MIRLILLLITLFFCFVCTNYEDNNPFDPDYQGNYFLNIEWEALPDTLGTFIEYIVPYSCSSGKDSLHTFNPDSALKNIIDTAIFKTINDSSFKLYFTKEGSKDISILGYTLNNTEIVSNDTAVIITTPFSINSVDSAVFGEQLQCYLSIIDPFDSLFIKDITDSVTWLYNVRDSVVKHITDTFNVRITDPNQFAIRAVFFDAHKNRSKEIIRNFNVTTIPPTVNAPDTFSFRVATVYLPITFSDDNDSVDTAYCFLNNDTTKKKVIYQDKDTIAISTGYVPINDTLLIWVKDQSGLTSNVDTTVLTTFIPDSATPLIRLFNQGDDTIKTASDSKEVSFLAWDNYGVAAVTCSTSNNIHFGSFIDSINDSTIWNVTITDLPFGQVFPVRTCAIDSFDNVSPCTTFYMYYDSTFTDTIPPKITILSPNANNIRVTTDTGTVLFTVTDLVDTVDTIDNGIDTVYYEINGSFAGPAIKVDNTTYTFMYTLTEFHWNTITLVARDSSGCYNKATDTLNINYNAKPSGISNISPDDGADNVENLGGVAFSWDHAQDADGDTIVYQIAYGTEISSLTKDTLSNNTYTANGLLGGISYIWHVKIMTELDTLFSPLDSNTYYHFKTIDHPATINIIHEDSATINDVDTFRISAQDDEGIKEYYWDFDGDGINEDTTTDTIKTSTYLTANTYTIVVTVADVNDSTTSDSATITITNYFPIIKANPTCDTLYIGYNDSIKLTPSATDDGIIVLYEWSFDSGNTFIQNPGVGDTSFLADTENLPKLPYYIFRATDEDNNSSIDTVYILINMIWNSITSDSWIIDRESFPVINDDNEIFVLGGWIGGNIKRDVWRSTDGEVWQNIAEVNSFTQRYKHAATIKNDTIFVAGGDVTHDIWQSADGGITWDSIGDLKDIDILFQNKLAGAEMVTFKDTFYLLGGNYGASKTNKVFSSMNGIDWDSLNTYYQVVDRRFKATDNFSTFSDNDSLWVFAENEVWHSDPNPFGDSWTRDSTVSEFSGYSGLIIYNETMYAVSNNTFWFSIDRGQNWQRMTSSAPWTGSNYQRAAVFNNKIWVFTDKGIWYSDDTP